MVVGQVMPVKALYQMDNKLRVGEAIGVSSGVSESDLSGKGYVVPQQHKFVPWVCTGDLAPTSRRK